MVHGYPDYGGTELAAIIHRMLDMGELAARLGSGDTYHRAGRIYWMDDFEHTNLCWLTDMIGAGASATISETERRNGKYSCRLETGNLEGNTTEIYKLFPYPWPSKWGFEFSFSLPEDLTYISTTVLIDDLTKLYGVSVRYMATTDILEILDDDDWHTIMTNCNVGVNAHEWHTVKVVIDYTNRSYVRVIFRDQVIDCSAYSMYSGPTGAWADMEFWITVKNNVDTECRKVYIDDVILTIEEP